MVPLISETVSASSTRFVAQHPNVPSQMMQLYVMAGLVALAIPATLAIYSATLHAWQQALLALIAFVGMYFWQRRNKILAGLSFYMQSVAAVDLNVISCLRNLHGNPRLWGVHTKNLCIRKSHPSKHFSKESC